MTSLFESVLFIALVLMLASLVIFAVAKTGKISSAESDQPVPPVWIVAAVISIWLALTAVLAASGALANFALLPPRVLLAPLPVLIGIMVLNRTAMFKHFLETAPAVWLVGFQTFRIVMELILWLLYKGGVIPVQMTPEGLNFDVLAGLTAPAVAYFCFVKKSWPLGVAIGWNIVALLLLINIVVIAILSSPVPFRLFMNEPANRIIAFFPFIWLPTFVVPLALLGHIASLRQLLARPQPASLSERKFFVSQ